MVQKSFLVGGAVRDMILGLHPKDRDYVVVGSTPEEMISEGFTQVGADFQVFLHPVSKEEYALASTKRKSGTGFSVCSSPDVTLEDDLSRRDLTINAMAMNGDGTIIDPFGGQSDLALKVLKHTTDAFADDPLRVLRVARFMARFGSEWSIHPKTMELMWLIQKSGALSKLTPERIWKETEKALSEPHPHLYFETLSGMGIFPEIDSMVGVEQPPEHHPEGDVFTHTMLCLKKSAEMHCDVETRFAVLCHDFGKASIFKKTGKLHGHEQAGVAVIHAFCDRIRVPNRFRELARLSSDNHTRCHVIFAMQPKKIWSLLVENLAANKNRERFEQFLQVCVCDAQGRGPILENAPYPQADAARHYLDAIMTVDTKSVAKRAASRGKTGSAIGDEIKTEQIQAIRKTLLIAPANVLY